MGAPPTRIYIIAGEQSGDQLGAGLMNGLKHLTRKNIKIDGIGGNGMQAEGLQSLFPMQELSLMGFAEILPHIFRLKRRIRETVADILTKKPDIVVTIDSPGFTFRVVKQLRAQGSTSQFIHYVAPTVWAYKPERAAKTARLFDALLTLFAFEVPYFTKESLATAWTGHPAAWKVPPQNITRRGDMICMFPGSRKGELKRILPLFQDIATRLHTLHPELRITMPIPQTLHETVSAHTKQWPCPVAIVDSSHRFEALAAASAAVCKSGTITLECALAGVPSIVTYKANPISIWIARRLITIPYAALPNILLSREIMPEYMPPKIDAETMATTLSGLFTDNEQAKIQKTAFQQLRALLLPSAERSPSILAAEQILAHAARSEAVSSS